MYILSLEKCFIEYSYFIANLVQACSMKQNSIFFQSKFDNSNFASSNLIYMYIYIFDNYKNYKNYKMYFRSLQSIGIGNKLYLFIRYLWYILYSININLNSVESPISYCFNIPMWQFYVSTDFILKFTSLNIHRCHFKITVILNLLKCDMEDSFKAYSLIGSIVVLWYP